MAENKMGWLKKILLIGAGLLCLGVAGLAAAIYLTDWNALKDKGAAYLSETLHHKVSIGKVEAGLFTGVTIHKISVANAAGFGAQPLFYNEEAKLHLNFLSLFSLLSGKLVVPGIEFKNPKVLIEKSASGTFNFSDMSSAPTQAGKPTAKAEASSAKAPDILIASFKVSGGDFSYRDLRTGSLTAIHGLDLDLTGISLQAGGKSRLVLKFNAETEGKKIPVSLLADFSLDLGAKKLVLHASKLGVPSLSVGVVGSVSDLSGDPAMDLNLDAEANLGTLVADLAPPSVVKGLPAGFKTEGGIKFLAKVKGRASRPEAMSFDARLELDKVGIKVADVPAIEGMTGELKIGPNKASLPGLTLTMAGSPLTIKLDAWDYSLQGLMGPSSAMKMSVRYSITSPKLALGPVIDFAMAPDSPAVAKAKAAEILRTGGVKDLRSAVPKGLSVEGEIKADALQYQGILTGKFRNKIRLAGQKLQSSSDLELFEGAFFERTNADFSIPGPAFNFQAGLDKMRLEKFVDAGLSAAPDSKALAQIKDKVSGILGFRLDGRGRGYKKPALTRNMDLKGHFQMLDGVLKKLDIQEKLAVSIPHPPTAEILRKDIHFGQMFADFTLKNEKFVLSNFVLSSGKDHRGGDLMLQASGQMQLGGALAFRVIPRFNPRLVKLEGLLQDAFADEAGWATYNYIGYAGPDLDHAKSDFKAGAVNAAKKVAQKQIEQVKQKVQQEGQKVLQEKGKVIETQGKELLKNLFGN
ncbi:MAG: hypothetical protein V4498_02465 [candidate division FCPU426 bacterium]